MKKIIVSVTNDLTTDQRVAKVCLTLYKNGFDVLLIGRKLKNSLPIKRKYQVKRIKLLFNKGFLFYAEYNLRLFLLLLFQKKDFLLSNDTDTLLANFFVSKIQNKRIIFDSHELFSEVPELVNKPLVKKIWVLIENWIIPKLQNNYTVCKSIADYYKTEYNSNFKVIRNLPIEKERNSTHFPFEIDNKKVILYQGAINIGRGLELMINTIQLLPNYIFVIVGSGDILNQLKQSVIKQKLTNQVKFLGKLTPEKLHKITPLADIGISLEEDLGLNYRYALPNKIFDYIQSEVPILVSNLPEMKQVVLDYNVGEVVENRSPKDLANKIESMLKKEYSQNLSIAKKELIWGNEERVLLNICNNLQ